MNTFEIDGVTYAYSAEPDDCQDAPWNNSDCHAPVRRAPLSYSYRANRAVPYGKRPGERVLHEGRHDAWLYDWSAAAAKARSDGCKDIAGTIRADFEHLRGWLNGDWHYCVLTVWPVSDPDNVEYLGRVESDDDYILQCAKDIAPAPYVHMIDV